ncbi:MAG: sulfate ABC transporter ATP-binding protein [Clostridia bacterium]|nr:sulfate ABC transporter ATP-binding protein [Clostridia bacterium]
MDIEVRGVTKRFGSFTALDAVNIRVPSGELVALLGPSGSGKTTLLRIIAGLEKPDAGSILFDGRDVTDGGLRERQVGFVFQHYALFRHMTVFDNVAFGLRVRPRRARPRPEEIRARVQALLELVQLHGLEDRYPSQLSGGQRQRVALARALAVEPKVLLLDEPFGALDARVRQDLRRWLRRLHDELQITSVLVTHDQEEALEVADRVVVMNAGRMEQVGTAEELYDHPATPFVCEFLGGVNLFRARLWDGRVVLGDDEGEPGRRRDADEKPAFVYVRPHDVAVERSRNGNGALPAVVRRLRALGPVVRLDLERADSGDRVEVVLSRERQRELGLEVGDEVFIWPRSYRCFPPA